MICPHCKRPMPEELTPEEREIQRMKTEAVFRRIQQAIRDVQEGRGTRYEKVSHGNGHYSLKSR